MNNLSHRVARAPALLTFFTCVLSVLAVPKIVICQQTPSKPPTPYSSRQRDSKPLVFTVTVMNKKGAYAMGLGPSNFAVLDEKEAQEITYFKGMDEPISVGILSDVSRSMYEPGRPELMKSLFNEALTRFVQQSNGLNEYFVIGFNERPQLLLDWTSNLSEINAALGKLQSVKPKGNSTALYDACYLGIEKLSHSTHPKRVMILISDGQDNISHYNYSDVFRLLKESDVLLYSIAMINGFNMSSTFGSQGAGILEELAVHTGGMAFLPDKQTHVRNLFDLIAAELRHQYSIGFNPANYPGDREWHRIKIKLVLPSNAPRELHHLIVRSRQGYYPNAKMN